MNKIAKLIFAFFIVSFFTACGGNEKDETIDKDLIKVEAPKIAYTIVNQYPHDTGAYTQGLQFYNGKLYEGTGDFKKSSLRITDYKTGKVEHSHIIGTDKIFGEGINIFKDKIYQLTWQSHIVYVYDVKNIDKPIKTFNWPYEGWGITNNGSSLIISDGSANIFFVNADDFKVTKSIPVTEDGSPIDNLNELEFIDGYLFANVWQTDMIVKIDPNNGHVVGKINLPGIIEQYTPGYKPIPTDEVLNGIAYDSTTKIIFITGKRWPKMFEITLN